ncbi:hypothetical protein GGTG_11721 [Gaeumannomyces tritici R3-111a-1]|uniref:Secreted protein n=1 Tax=Gaeumannomyces tritici (strain R3-111a-1) TaxID=644352 RepID=J3PDZ8_GAET3|nr:hypothetical protein GGTG_11721 [Gaeumannomyces tritici R3-111a-1]EJT70698.1 hypothetical protein GGTG_11721 [Gaeumannomyces tritici R3-111a-1]
MRERTWGVCCLFVFFLIPRQDRPQAGSRLKMSALTSRLAMPISQWALVDLMYPGHGPCAAVGTHRVASPPRNIAECPVASAFLKGPAIHIIRGAQWPGLPGTPRSAKQKS